MGQWTWAPFIPLKAEKMVKSKNTKARDLNIEDSNLGINGVNGGDAGTRTPDTTDMSRML